MRIFVLTRPWSVVLTALLVACALLAPRTLLAEDGVVPRSEGSVVVRYDRSSVSAASASLAGRGLAVRRRLFDGAGVVVDVPDGVDARALARQLEQLPGVLYAEPDAPVELQWTPDDPGYVSQWAFSHIQAPQAWDITIGSPDVIVAVLDTGIDLDHPDLAARILPGGYDFGDGDANVDDRYGHGTHCAGIVAAETDNAVGVAGTAPRVRILPVKVFTDVTNYGSTSMLADGIRFATDAGADIITMSLGTPETTTYLEEAISYARTQGVLLVASAGNASASELLYPARSAGVIGVVATTDADQRATYSNYGVHTDLSAPGSNIYSTTIGGYGWKTGTSMAAPYVAGALALLRSSAPTATAEQLTAALQASAQDLDISGWDELTGFGLIQVRDAMEYLDGPYSWDATAPVTTTDAMESYLHSARITLNAIDDDGSGVAFTGYRLDGADEASGTVIDVSGYGTHTLSYRSVDVAGNPERTNTLTFRIVEYLAPDVSRVSGEDRYDTCVALSESTFAGSSVPTVVVACGEDFADALTASSLAGAYSSPLLLVAKSALPGVVESELGRLGARHVLLVGGTTAIVPAVEEALLASGVSVQRIGGVDRYDTAARVARAVRDKLGSALPKTVFVARGDVFADALCLAPLAARRGIPVLLTRPNALPVTTAETIVELDAGYVVVAGGTSAVSPSVLSALDDLAGIVSAIRLQGTDRYGTAVAVAQYGIGRGWATSNYLGLSTGVDFPDALGGGVVAGAHGGLVLFTRPDTLPTVTRDFIATQPEDLVSVVVFGGETTVAESVLSAVAAIRF